jgi:hypothetical protein
MESEKMKPESAAIESTVMKGTAEMGYWDFKKEICSAKGWQLRRTDPQTYEVLNTNNEMIGIFKSQVGYFPKPASSQ